MSRDVKEEVLSVVRGVKQYLKFEQDLGVLSIRSKSKTKNVPVKKDNAKDEKLGVLRKDLQSCKECKLGITRTNLVFGEGDKDAVLMFIGEAPGRDEDLQGKPFVGRAGQMLTKIIEAMGLSREQVYIANVLKCRPPENRNPMPDEIDACEKNFLRQIEIIKPKVICALGKFSAQTLLKTETPISALRGNFYDYHGIKLMPTYHPAYLLRNPSEKKVVWQDVQKIMKYIKEDAADA